MEQGEDKSRLPPCSRTNTQCLSNANAQFNKLTSINDNSLVKSVSVISLSSTDEKICQMIKSLLYFLWAGLFEIGGGYLIWLWLREGKPFWWGILGELL